MAAAIPKADQGERSRRDEDGQAQAGERPLRVNEDGLALLSERLRAANRDNPDFEAQRERLLGAVKQALDGLLRHFAPEIERVLAIGTWAFEGIDPRTLPEVEDLVLEIVTRTDQRDFDFDMRVGMEVFGPIDDAYGESSSSSSTCCRCRSGATPLSTSTRPGNPWTRSACRCSSGRDRAPRHPAGGKTEVVRAPAAPSADGGPAAPQPPRCGRFAGGLP